MNKKIFKKIKNFAVKTIYKIVRSAKTKFWFSKQKKLSTFNFQLSTKSGFSLIELIVVVGIMVVVTSVTLASNARFSGSVTLENLAYEIALTVRQAQFFGMNVREASLDGVGSFESGYGVLFDKSNPTSFIYFADVNNNHFYDGESELLDVYSMARGNFINYLCVDGGCSNPESSTVSKLYISFKRPNPDAWIKTDKFIDCGSGLNNSCASAKIYISSPKTNIPNKVVVVSSTGQISISTE